jgi:predicted dehydrogenase
VTNGNGTNGKVRFGIIGAGGIAQAYAKALTSCDGARLEAIADIREDAAERLASTAGCKAYKSYQALAEAGGVDAVVVCTPPVTHADVCSHFLERDVHVLCEKPFCLDSTEARRLIALAEERNVLITMASKFRYVDDVIRARNIIQSGILGEVILIENTFAARVDMSSRWNSRREVSGGGVLIDNGTHSLDIVRYLLGPLKDLRVLEGKRVQGLEVEDTVNIFVRSMSNVLASIDLSWSISKELDSYLNIYGSHGTILVGWKESKYRQSSQDEWIKFGRGYDKIQAFRDQVKNFAGAILGREALLITGEDAIASVEIVETAYRALKAEQWFPKRSTPESEVSGYEDAKLKRRVAV